MGAAERWEGRPVSAAVIGPTRAGLPWLRRHLARHPTLAVPPEPSGFWSHVYGVDPAARPGHWAREFAGLRGRLRVAVDEGLAALPAWALGAMAAAHPGLRVLYVMRDPAARSWDALRAFHARHGDDLGLGDGLGWVDEALRTPDEFRGRDLGLLRDADYAGHVRRWAYGLPADRIFPCFFEDIAAAPAAALWATFSEFLKVGPGGVEVDGGPPPGHLESPLPAEAPPAVAERLASLHRRQVRELAAIFGDRVQITERWPS